MQHQAAPDNYKQAAQLTRCIGVQMASVVYNEGGGFEEGEEKDSPLMSNL